MSEQLLPECLWEVSASGVRLAAQHRLVREAVDRNPAAVLPLNFARNKRDALFPYVPRGPRRMAVAVNIFQFFGRYLAVSQDMVDYPFRTQGRNGKELR